MTLNYMKLDHHTEKDTASGTSEGVRDTPLLSHD